MPYILLSLDALGCESGLAVTPDVPPRRRRRESLPQTEDRVSLDRRKRDLVFWSGSPERGGSLKTRSHVAQIASKVQP